MENILEKAVTAKFQFHKGTIKPCFCPICKREQNDFNSIKVRLNLRITQFSKQVA